MAAKLILAEKSELKESLTEHLYTIIQQNEIRKAARLAELMKELGLEGDSSLEMAPIPPLLSFSPINTLHRPCTIPTSPLSPGPYEAQSQLIASSEQISGASNISQLQENNVQTENAGKLLFYSVTVLQNIPCLQWWHFFFLKKMLFWLIDDVQLYKMFNA